MPRLTRTPMWMSACGLTVALLLTGCGGSGTTTGASPASPGTVAPTIAGSTEAFCTGVANLGLSPDQVGGDTASPGNPTAATQSLAEQIDQIQQNLPDDAPQAVSAALTQFANYLRSAGEGRSPDPEAAAALDQAQTVIADYIDRTCYATASPSQAPSETGSPSPSLS